MDEKKEESQNAIERWDYEKRIQGYVQKKKQDEID